MIATKVCPRCGKEKAVACFWRDPRQADGRQRHCKKCRAAQIAAGRGKEGGLRSGPRALLEINGWWVRQ